MYSNQINEKIRQLHQEGNSAYKISKILQISKATVLKRGKKIGLDFSSKSKLKNPVRMKDCKNSIIELHLSGLSTNKISKETGYSQSRIWDMLNKLGYDVGHVYYEVDLKFFDVINSEIKAYYLGMWYADGNVRPDQIRLQVADKEIIIGAKKALQYDGPIRIIHPRKEGRKIQYCLGIARKELVKSVTDKGCPPNKSLILTFPTCNIMIKKL